MEFSQKCVILVPMQVMWITKTEGDEKKSQEKVNQYKESKKNRKEIVKKEKQRATYTKIIAGVVAAILVAWLGYSAVVTVQNAEGPAVKVDTPAVSDYVNGL